MRKKAIKKRLGSRKNIYKILRTGNFLESFNNHYGKGVLLNPVKHFLMQKPYKTDEYNIVLQRAVRQYTEYVKSVMSKQEQEGV